MDEYDGLRTLNTILLVLATALGVALWLVLRFWPKPSSPPSPPPSPPLPPISPPKRPTPMEDIAPLIERDLGYMRVLSGHYAIRNPDEFLSQLAVRITGIACAYDEARRKYEADVIEYGEKYSAYAKELEARAAKKK